MGCLCPSTRICSDSLPYRVNPMSAKHFCAAFFLRAEIHRAENGLPTGISGSQREAALLHGEEPVTKVAQPRNDVAGGMISSLVRFE